MRAADGVLNHVALDAVTVLGRTKKPEAKKLLSQHDGCRAVDFKAMRATLYARAAEIIAAGEETNTPEKAVTAIEAEKTGEDVPVLVDAFQVGSLAHAHPARAAA